MQKDFTDIELHNKISAYLTATSPLVLGLYRNETSFLREKDLMDLPSESHVQIWQLEITIHELHEGRSVEFTPKLHQTR